MKNGANRLLVEVGETGFEVVVAKGEYPFGELRIALSANRLARGLSDIALLYASTRGETTAKLREHLTEHFGASQAPSPQCEFCKLQGKLLAAEGRRRLSDREQRQRSLPPVRVLPEGASGAAIERAFAHAAKRDAERLRRLPRLNGAKVGRDTDGVWF